MNWVTDVSFVAASADDVAAGLLGWISCTVNDRLVLGGLTLRRTQDGRLVVSYPCRRDSAGHQRFYVRPRNQHAQRDADRQILLALGCQEGDSM